ncbi:sugar-binding protein, partial [Candidatus Venteria ishoeyi]|uniref:sugar-binding protein n=1 Tax=Candidatus Venteria ishoeyi TaxID=1899563 RepID=UPI00255D103C
MMKKYLYFMLFSGLLLCRSGFAGTGNGYYHKDNSTNFVHYDAVASYATSPVVIDGILSTGEWNTALARDFYKFDRADNRMRILHQYDDTYLYLLVQVDDDKLYDDNPQVPTTRSGSGFINWDTGKDDGLEIYIDANNSRDSMAQVTDKVLAFSILGRHFRYDTGDGAGETGFFAEISPVPTHSAGITRGQAANNGATMSFAVGINGSVNINSDTDQGYVAEIALPWSHLGVSPVPLSFVSSNIIITENDSANGFTEGENSVLDQPQELDRFYKWFSDGLNGPKNYARVYLLPKTDITAPGAVTGLSISHTQAMSALLSFNASGDDANSGMAAAYDIRYSNSAISTEADWEAASVYQNRFIPRLAGKPEQLRILGLQAATNYFVAVRAVDYAGNRGPIASTALTTLAAPADYGKGHIYPAPAGKAFVYENGDLFMPSPQAMGISWFGLRDLYTRSLWYEVDKILVNWSEVQEESGNARKLVAELADKKVNLVRLFIEDLAFADTVAHPDAPRALPGASASNDGVAWLEFPATAAGSNYIPETLQFLDDFMHLCAEYGIYVVITPWDNYFYRKEDKLFAVHPYNVVNGGTLNTREAFITDTGETRTAQKQRLNTLYNIVSQHHNFFGWEMMNEWDNKTFAERDDTKPEIWQAQRMAWIQDLLAHLRMIDKTHMITVSSVIEEPQFGLQDFLLRSDLFDFVAIHNYGTAISDPRKANDSDMTIRPALDAAQMVRYMVANSRDHRPVYDLESGPIDVFKLDANGKAVSGYPADYSQAQDETILHHIQRSSLAAGLAGISLRWPSKVLEPLGPQLTSNMRTDQQQLSTILENTQVNYKTFVPSPWEKQVASSVSTLQITASSDGQQGLVHLLQDTRKALASVPGSVLTLTGMSDGIYRVASHDNLGGAAQTQDVTASNGTWSVALPAFN